MYKKSYVTTATKLFNFPALVRPFSQWMQLIHAADLDYFPQLVRQRLRYHTSPEFLIRPCKYADGLIIPCER